MLATSVGDKIIVFIAGKNDFIIFTVNGKGCHLFDIAITGVLQTGVPSNWFPIYCSLR